MASKALIAAIGLFFLFTIYRIIVHRRRSRGLPYPPGPKPRFLVGSLGDLPRVKEWEAYAQWRKDYGDVTYLTVLGSSMLILNSAKAVNDLLDKRGSIYSDRPRLPMINELMGWDWNLVLMPYGKRFAAHRRIVQHQFSPIVVEKSYLPIISTETRLLLAKLTHSPGDYAKHLKHTAGAIIMMITYGYRVASKDDEFVSLSDEVKEVRTAVGTPGSYLVDVLPFLKYIPERFPGAHFKTQARLWRTLADEMRERPFRMVKEQMAAGTHLPSMVASLLETDLNTRVFNWEETIMNCAGVVYSAGADTTVSTLTNFFLAMQLYPNIQQKAQREIDAITGRQRLPEFSDREALPYITAIVKETIRWKPVTPLGVPHRTTQNDYYEGMFIPRGTTVVSNIWAILHNEDVYENPEDFNPERFLPSGARPTGAPDPAHAAFGFGRRVCPGSHLAEVSIWLAVAYVLSVFDVKPALDEHGREIVPQVEWSSGLDSAPSPFECIITPRSQEILDMI